MKEEIYWQIPETPERNHEDPSGIIGIPPVFELRTSLIHVQSATAQNSSLEGKDMNMHLLSLTNLGYSRQTTVCVYGHVLTVCEAWS